MAPAKQDVSHIGVRKLRAPISGGSGNPTGTACQQAQLLCQQAWGVCLDSKGLDTSCEVQNATQVPVQLTG